MILFCYFTCILYNFNKTKWQNINKERTYIGNCCKNSFLIFDCRNIKLSKKNKSDLSLKNIIKYAVDSALFINNYKGFDIFLEIFEKDGSESESCGNGLILVADFLNLNKGKIKMINSTVRVEGNMLKQSILMNTKFLKIKEFSQKNYIFVKVGEPHVVILVKDINKFNLLKIGKELQKNYLGGVNVDVIQKIDEFHYLIKTYERGVFNITKSCGTGSLSSFIAISYFNKKRYNKPIEFKSKGGNHLVSKTNNMLKLEVLKKFCKVKNL